MLLCFCIVVGLAWTSAWCCYMPCSRHSHPLVCTDASGKEESRVPLEEFHQPASVNTPRAVCCSGWRCGPALSVASYSSYMSHSFFLSCLGVCLSPSKGTVFLQEDVEGGQGMFRSCAASVVPSVRVSMAPRRKLAVAASAPKAASKAKAKAKAPPPADDAAGTADVTIEHWYDLDVPSRGKPSFRCACNMITRKWITEPVLAPLQQELRRVQDTVRSRLSRQVPE